MSRDIKFRAWHEDLEVMVYSDKRNKSTYDIDYEFVINEKGSLVCNWHEDTEDVCGNFIESSGTLDNLMQYTGLKDKNGKEVYEGDIIESPLWEAEPYEIVFKDYAFKARDIRKKIMYGSDLFFDIDDLLSGCVGETFEVIGNIYENPELLEGER